MPIELDEARLAELAYYGVTLPPTQDELPYDDGIPMESPRHAAQMRLLMEAIKIHWRDRQDFFVGGNMFVYFSLEQARNQDFKGPDFFLVLDVPRQQERKSWVVWEEGKGPDIVIELLSVSTAENDRTEKKLVYQNKLRVPEYYWFDPFTGEWAGFVLQNHDYVPLTANSQGQFTSQITGLTLLQWDGVYEDMNGRWLRWATADGIVLPTAQEIAEREQQRAEQEKQRAEQEKQRADRLAARLRELGIDPEVLD